MREFAEGETGCILRRRTGPSGTLGDERAEGIPMPDAETRGPAGSCASPPVIALAVGVTLVGLTALLFLVARELGWARGWIYLGLSAAGLSVNLGCLLEWNPTLIGRRMRMGAGTKRWDVFWSVLNAPVWIAVFVVAVLETRGTDPGPLGVGWLLGMALYLPGWCLIIGSMAANPFFEKTVRIQTDQGHHVIDTGPYAVVRHPGYVGFSLWLLATPFLLASPWTLFPVLLAIASLGVRTALEDRTLQAELPGYAEYTTRVRYRLIPGVW